MPADEEPRTVPAAVARAVAGGPERAALVTPTRRLTWADLQHESRRLSAVLVARGVSRRARVGVVLPDGVDCAVLAVALWRVGAVLVPVSTQLPAADVVRRLRDAAVQFLVLGRDVPFAADALPSPLLPALRAVWRWDDIDAAVADERAVALADALHVRGRPADDLAIMFTEEPAGVIHTHGNALRAASAARAVQPVSVGARITLPAPLAHIDGLAALLSALVGQVTLEVDAEMRPGVRGAAIAETFGTLIGVEVRVIDPATLQQRARGETGELWVRGPHLMRGICGRTRAQTFTVDGWYRTGRAGRLDDAGRLRLDGDPA
jgi:acyl-CoA synthetase (AMP-forming)/AMP-acid ligase II